jgi:hypothetical protein
VHGSAFLPPDKLCARAMTPFEPLLTRMQAPGAAFLVLDADKVEG